MTLEGGCYCGTVRYAAGGTPGLKAECHCRECQYITGGGPNYFMMMPVAEFSYTRGAPARFTRDDIPNPVTREFCPKCGTHLATRIPGLPTLVLKVGGLDDPAQYGKPGTAIYLCDAQPFHMVPDGIVRFETVPGA
ncbi:GFA family protein [Novosphingobium malaysiense]|uniref:CENP-V/GFA domain-containing protein n=1 Tax=Novosphingobium malaysiense TaxID=1348853 RepID=A0A0B1ZGF2_9SPHN|nr:GFA family protein [Novosphingobium malaysiense]KHK90151.1 hypothetical protein LK12_15840 [Novosphingobium malaysiense]